MSRITQTTRLERVEHVLGSGSGVLDFAVDGKSAYRTWVGDEDADWDIEDVESVENADEDRFLIYPEAEYFYDDLEQTAGVDLRQRYLSIPRLREATCERLGCTRAAFDDSLLDLCQQNIGKLELSGAPMDTAAKNSALGIKQIALTDDDGLVTTSQSSQQVMAGVEQFGKQYYYLAVHDRDITYTQEEST